MQVPDYLIQLVKQVGDVSVENTFRLIDIWSAHMVFQWFWWMEVALSIVPWVFWWFVRKKESTGRLLLAGFLVIIIASYLDFVGVDIGLWAYNAKTLPFMPPYIPWDFTLMPVTAMLCYQFFPRANAYLKAAGYALFASYIVQPVFQWMRIYDPIMWPHFYSVPIFFVIYLIGHAVTRIKTFQPLE